MISPELEASSTAILRRKGNLASSKIPFARSRPRVRRLALKNRRRYAGLIENPGGVFLVALGWCPGRSGPEEGWHEPRDTRTAGPGRGGRARGAVAARIFPADHA